MVARSLCVLLAVFMGLAACGDGSRQKSRERTFTHDRPQTTSPSDEGRVTIDQDLTESTPETPDPQATATPSPAQKSPQDNGFEAGGGRATPPPAPAQQPPAKTPPPPAAKPEKQTSIPAYEMPEKFRERLQEARPDLVVPSSKKFSVANQHLHISTKESTFTFSAVLKITGKQDEEIELKCKFNQGAESWACSDMFPTNPKIAAERRLQATVHCLDTHVCQWVGVELYVVIDGKTESKLFQNQKFWARRASSGDSAEEDEEGVKPLKKPRPAGPGRKDPKVYEKPTPGGGGQQPAPAGPQPAEPGAQQQPGAPAPPPMTPEDQQGVGEEEETEDLAPLDENGLNQLIDDPNAAIEISAPVPMPSPQKGQYSIPGIEKLRPEIGEGKKNQAIGSHAGGYLRQGTPLPSSGPGILRRQRENRNFGTDMTIELLTGAAAAVDKKFPNKSPFVIADISKQGGGKLGGHSSHQTGLDVDIVFPANHDVREMWSLCGNNQRCRPGSSISRDFDEARFWNFVKTLTCASDHPVIAMFIDNQIKRHMCEWARQQGEDTTNPSSCAFKTLQAMKHWPGHHNHVHVRFRCPGNRDCRDATVSLGRANGC